MCGGALKPAFSITVLGRHEASFHLCQACRSLVVPAPHWLEEAYGTSLVPDPDQGALARTLFIHRCIRRMRAGSIGLVPRRCRTLEFGAGRGFLLRLLLDEGKDAWGFDPYPIAILGEHRVRKEMPEGTFDLITAIEVLEHTLDPVPTLRRLCERLEPEGLLLVSTELYDESLHGPEWIYLAPEHGQHITLFSAEGLRRVAEQAGLRWIGSLGWGDKPFAHLLVKANRRIGALTLWRLQRRHRRGEKRLWRDGQV
jgi:SAM-dependent methyltransferase